MILSWLRSDMSDVMRKPYYARKKNGGAWGKLVIHEKETIKSIENIKRYT